MKENNNVGPHPAEAQLLLALDGELQPGEAKEISQHVDHCAVCRAQWDRWNRISERIEEHQHNLLQAQAPPVRPQRSSGSVRAIAALTGIAAALLCMVWLFGRASPPPPPLRVSETPESVVAVTPPSAPAAEPPVTRRVQQRNRVSRPVPANNSFIALPFSDNALPLGDATVVRVQMAVEELQSAGLPILDARPGTPVEADVLVGIDGLPRGIRLVHLVQ